MTTTELRKRFTKFVWDKWVLNGHNLKEISCVYAFVSFYPYERNSDNRDIVYIGSTTQLYSRHKSHKIPNIVHAEFGRFCLLYYLPMKKGFYDYEIKLIKKLKPAYNTQHKKHG